MSQRCRAAARRRSGTGERLPFRAYYVPLRQRHVKRRRTILLLVLFGAVVLGLLAWLLGSRARPLLDISRDPSTAPVPSATASVQPEKLDQALPPEDNRK